jgi:hypothetical protein
MARLKSSLDQRFFLMLKFEDWGVDLSRAAVSFGGGQRMAGAGVLQPSYSAHVGGDDVARTQRSHSVSTLMLGSLTLAVWPGIGHNAGQRQDLQQLAATVTAQFGW